MGGGTLTDELQLHGSNQLTGRFVKWVDEYLSQRRDI